MMTILISVKWYLIVGFVGFFKDFYLFICRERGREGESEGEKHQCVVASLMPPYTGDLACKPGLCPRLGIKPETF